jgi:DNA-directed RNA polymerase specialized sigma24 family protein
MVQNGAFLETRRELLLTARRFTRCDEEARDLTQDALVAALARGFDDWHSPARRAWLRGVVRRRAAFVARTESRRRRRESLEDSTRGTVGEHWAWESQFLSSLPRSLRVVAALASIDLSAAEIRWLLGAAAAGRSESARSRSPRSAYSKDFLDWQESLDWMLPMVKRGPCWRRPIVVSGS